jgi:hypothetical protein
MMKRRPKSGRKHVSFESHPPGRHREVREVLHAALRDADVDDRFRPLGDDGLRRAVAIAFKSDTHNQPK